MSRGEVRAGVPPDSLPPLSPPLSPSRMQMAVCSNLRANPGRGGASIGRNTRNELMKRPLHQVSLCVG